jgi:hypothetical protein
MITDPLSQFGNFSNIDSEMSQAESLMSSGSLSSQLQGQMQMEQAMQQFSTISTVLSNLSQMEQQCINNSKINS